MACLKDARNTGTIIAARVAAELHDGGAVNLGIDIPGQVSSNLSEGVELVI
jgi:acyl CoA:acetate/3-ketoacid CoA transferase beta subunit